MSEDTSPNEFEDDPFTVEGDPSLSGAAPADSGDSRANEGTWPPRPSALPQSPWVSDRVLELDGREEVLAPPPPPEFTETRLKERRPAPSTGRPHAVAYDRRRRAGRTAWDELFDVQEEDFRRRRRALGWQGARAGAFCMLLVCLSFLPARPMSFAVATAAGAGLGAAAAQLGDSVWTWLGALGIGGLAFAPLMPSPVVWFIAEGACLMLGWLTGLVREARR